MLPTPWFIFGWIKSYRWLFLLFTCHCVPGTRMELANRLTQRNRFLDDSQPSNVAFNPLVNTASEYAHTDGSYRSLDVPKRYSSDLAPVVSESASESHESRIFDQRILPPPPPTQSFRLFKQALLKSSDLVNSADSNGGSSFGTSTCVAPDSRNGLCYDAAECAEHGGIPMGRCGGASGSPASVCCLFETTCGGSVQERHVYFRNPTFPQPTDSPQLCRLKVNKLQTKNPICQLKLNFVEFDIAKPVEGNCTQDVFSVSGQNENNIIPRICGFNSGQHYYIAVDESGLVNLQLVFRGQYPRKFDIHIQQIECGSKDLAPPHCLQYYDSTQGKIKSFNYESKSSQGSAEEREAAYNSVYEGYPNNIDYLICIRKETGFCSVSYEFMSDSSGAVLPFSVGMSADGAVTSRRGSQSRGAEPLPISLGASIQSNDCEDDYLIIGGLRVCSKTMVTTTTRASAEDDHVTLGTSSTTENSPVYSSTEARANDTLGTNKNGELHEMMDENAVPTEFGPMGPAETQQNSALRRPHRRANYQYYFSDRLTPSRTRGVSAKRNAPAPNHLMATDWTPGPFQLRFVSNGANNARGFYLAYRQNPCRI